MLGSLLSSLGLPEGEARPQPSPVAKAAWDRREGHCFVHFLLSSGPNTPERLRVPVVTRRCKRCGRGAATPLAGSPPRGPSRGLHGLPLVSTAGLGLRMCGHSEPAVRVCPLRWGLGARDAGKAIGGDAWYHRLPAPPCIPATLPGGAGTPDLVTDPTSHNQNQPLWGLWGGQGPGEIPGPIRNSRRKGERLARSPSGIGDLLSRELRPRKCRLVKVPPSPPVFQPCLNHGQKVPKHPLTPGGGKSSPGRLGGSHHGTMALLGVAPLLTGHRWW